MPGASRALCASRACRLGSQGARLKPRPGPGAAACGGAPVLRQHALQCRRQPAADAAACWRKHRARAGPARRPAPRFTRPAARRRSQHRCQQSAVPGQAGRRLISHARGALATALRGHRRRVLRSGAAGLAAPMLAVPQRIPRLAATAAACVARRGRRGAWVRAGRALCDARASGWVLVVAGGGNLLARIGATARAAVRRALKRVRQLARLRGARGRPWRIAAARRGGPRSAEQRGEHATRRRRACDGRVRRRRRGAADGEPRRRRRGLRCRLGPPPRPRRAAAPPAARCAVRQQPGPRRPPP